MKSESILQSARGGLRLLRDDPLGTLLPGAVVLGLQALGLGVLQLVWRDASTLWLLVLILLLIAGRTIIAAPFRSLVLASAARQVDRPFSALRRAPSLALVWTVSALIEALVVGALLIATLGPAWWLLARGTYWGAVLLVTLTTLPILIVGIGCRVLFAYASIEATVGRKSPFRALSLGLEHASRDGPAVFGLLLGGEVFTALGGLLCGAGALPGAVFADLALVHRWSHQNEAPE